MATTAIVQVSVTPRQSDAARDVVEHNLHFHTDAAAGGVDWQFLADQLKTIFSLSGSLPLWSLYSGRGILVKCYNRADAKPRPIMASSTYTPASWDSQALAPRQVALCLSYYSSRNLPRDRGRIYIGPWNLSIIGERATTAVQQGVLDLGKRLYAFPPVTGTSLQWVHGIYSEADATFRAATSYWVNDIYDTQRRRTPKEATRQRYTP